MMNQSEINDLFDSFKKFKILVIGDLMIDSYLWGVVSRISPEAPVPVVDCKKRENRLGGAANVALNIKSLGAEPILCAVTGKDDKAAIVSELLRSNELSDTGIIADESRPTTIKFRVIAHNQHVVRVDEEQTHALSAEEEKRFINNILSIFEKGNINAVIFEDYDKGTITPAVIGAITNFCRSNNIPTLVDPKKRNFCEYRGITLFKPNFKELTEGTKSEIPKTDFDALHGLCVDFLKKTDNRYILTTLSELGMMICDKEQYHHIPAEKRDIADVSGAGDTVIAVTALCFAAGLDPVTSTRIANLAGGLVCEKPGVIPIECDILKQEMIDKQI